MRRRSSRSKSVGLTGAVLVELGTILAIIAFAQPSWTRGLIEQVNSPPTAPPSAVSAVSNDNSSQASSLQASPQQTTPQQTFAQQAWPQTQSGRNNPGWDNSGQPAWQPSPAASWSDNTDRIAQAAWTPTRLPTQEYRFAPQYPVYPPSVNTSAPPAWSAGY